MIDVTMKMELTQIQTQFRPHSPMDNPELTGAARGLTGVIEDILAKGKLSSYEKMLQTEAILLSKWQYADAWEDILDAPLIAHADAALELKRHYDAVVGIQKAGVPYALIFEIMGFPVYDIDFSHHRRHMKHPIIDQSQLVELRRRINVLVTDVDFVTGKTLTKVVEYLRQNGVNGGGAYIGLSKWPGIESESFCIDDDTVDFETFWTSTHSGLRHLRSTTPYKNRLIPNDLRVYCPNPSLDKNERVGSIASRRVARYFKGLEHQMR